MVDQNAMLTGFGALVGVIVWLVRLESKVLQNTKDLDDIWQEHDELEEALTSKLNDVSESLARIEGRLGINPEK